MLPLGGCCRLSCRVIVTSHPDGPLTRAPARSRMAATGTRTGGGHEEARIGPCDDGGGSAGGGIQRRRGPLDRAQERGGRLQRRPRRRAGFGAFLLPSATRCFAPTAAVCCPVTAGCRTGRRSRTPSWAACPVRRRARRQRTHHRHPQRAGECVLRVPGRVAVTDTINARPKTPTEMRGQVAKSGRSVGSLARPLGSSQSSWRPSAVWSRK